MAALSAAAAVDRVGNDPASHNWDRTGGSPSDIHHADPIRGDVVTDPAWAGASFRRP
jgi:hypothetical protein